MAWQDRDYNRGGSGGAGDYLMNPSGILSLSVPFGTWLGVRVRLHFWLLLSIAFALAEALSGASIFMIVINIGLLIFALLLHEFGHRASASWVGGRHDEFMLWPAGGMIFPSVPPGPWPMFVGNAGGMAVNLVLGLGSYVAFHLQTGGWIRLPLNPLLSFGGQMSNEYYPGHMLVVCLGNFALVNWGLVLVNLLPYFWFDGGFLLQAILNPFAGGRGALNITCIFGMILAVPMFFIALTARDLISLFVWALLFSSAYTARTGGNGVSSEESGDYAVAVGESRGIGGRIKSGRWPKIPSAKTKARERREREKIDAILAKVSAQGMHSLTWWEKRTLRKGSARLR